MKQLFIVLTAVILTAGMFQSQQASAQAPQKISYQAVIRDAANNLVTSHAIGMKISILQGSATGTAVYTETQTPNTNANGLVSIEIGTGTGFDAINWATGPFFIKTETDPTGGKNYSIVGTSQLLSTPYALYAAKAGNGFSGNWIDLAGKPNLAVVATSGSYSDLISTPAFAAVATSGSFTDLSNKPAFFSGIYADLTAKPVLSTVATSGSYTDLLNKPTLFSGVYADLTAKPVLFSGSYADLKSKPSFAIVATTGSYSDLLNKPTLFSGSYTDLTNKPTFAAIATSGSYADLQNKPLLVSTATTPLSGDVLYYNGAAWTLLSKGTDGQVLKLETGAPKWKNLSDYGSVIPAAIFTVSQLVGTTVQSITVDASGVVDDADAPTTLQVRWKWEDTGTVTAWTTTKTATYTYSTEGAKNITLEVKDSQGNIGTSSKAIVINNTLFSPMVSTAIASNITTSSFTIGGSVIANGASTITAYGVCWATTQNPTIANSKTNDGTGLGSFTSSITGLTAGTTYYIRAYATNSTTTSYGSQVTVATPLTVVFPTVTTTAATNVTESAATCAGSATATGGATITEKGICWSTNQSPSISDSKITSGNGTGAFTIQLSGLAPNIIYYARAYAVNSAGVGYGTQVNFNTLKTLPVVATKDVTSISAMGGVTGGSITSSGGGTISDKGLCWGEGQNPTVNDNKISSGTGTAAFTSSIITAVPGTTYYVRAYATNELGTVYGPQKTFTALSNVTYYNFESGMKPAGWGGAWTVTNSKSFEGSYCLKSLPGVSSQTTLTVTLANDGQISFYYFLDWGDSYWDNTQTHLVFYIDNVNIYDFAASGGWNQGLFDVTAGKHTFTWQFNQASGGAGYIDYIVLPK
jgi:hypothetical protein